LPLRIGVLHCGILADNCNDRYFGFTAALNSAGIHWRLSGILEGWNATNTPPAAAKLLADDPAIDVLWSENGGGTKALALAAANLPRPIMVLGTDRSPRLEKLLHQPARNPLLAIVAQSPEIMGRCAAAAAIAALGRQGPQVLAQKCLGPTPVYLYSHD
jgi:ABC-type sugar transport system substrate-binding protein